MEEKNRWSGTSPSLPQSSVPQIEVEFVSEEEMALIEAALSSATRFSLSSSSLSLSSTISSLSSRVSTHLQTNSRSVHSLVPFQSQRSLAGCSSDPTSIDIEDSGGLKGSQKIFKQPVSLFQRFRSRRGLAVTDITSTEWCEKQMEFILQRGKPKKTAAMKAGSVRHAKLEEEVVKRVEVRIHSIEESWVVKFMNFIAGTNRLLFEGLTRELPVVGFVEGVWIIGVIDEVRMPTKDTAQNPSLVDTKTRHRATLPSEAQKRNARLQLMCYKYLWDSLVAVDFPMSHFYDFFGLNPHYILSEDAKQYIASSGFHAKKFEDVVTYFRNVCCLLPPADDQLLLRYELQADQSLLGEDQFTYDASWVKNQIQWCLEFWSGKREPAYVSEGEQWKCQVCSFAATCPLPTTYGRSAE